MKKIILLAGLCLVLAGCAPGAVNPQKISDNSTSVKGDAGSDICAEFPADFVYSVLKKTIQEMKPSTVGADQGCLYYYGNNEFVAIYFENLSVETNKKGQAWLDRTLTTDPSITMEHYIAMNKENNVNAVYLVINPNRFARIDRSSTKVTTNEQIIELAARVADKLQGKLNIKIEKNPIDLAAAKVAALGDSQEQVVRTFLEALSAKDIQKALGMMDADNDTKQAWGVNFNTIKSLEIKKIEEIYKEDWTPTRQSFKATLNVQVTDAGLQIGWENGENFRWITVEKNSNGWQVHELANNP
jgi:hypothetical protein